MASFLKLLCITIPFIAVTISSCPSVSLTWQSLPIPQCHLYDNVYLSIIVTYMTISTRPSVSLTWQSLPVHQCHLLDNLYPSLSVTYMTISTCPSVSLTWQSLPVPQCHLLDNLHLSLSVTYMTIFICPSVSLIYISIEVTSSASAPVSPSVFKPIEIPKNVRRMSSLTERPRETLDDYMNKITGDFKTVLEQLKAERWQI